MNDLVAEYSCKRSETTGTDVCAVYAEASISCLRQYIEDNDATVQDLSRMLDVSPVTVDRWFAGKQKPASTRVMAALDRFMKNHRSALRKIIPIAIVMLCLSEQTLSILANQAEAQRAIIEQLARSVS